VKIRPRHPKTKERRAQFEVAWFGWKQRGTIDCAIGFWAPKQKLVYWGATAFHF